MIPSKKPRIPRLRLNPAGTLVFAALVFGVSAALTLSGGNAVFCDRLAPLGVAAALSAFLIAFTFRLLSRTVAAPGETTRGVLGCTLLLAAVGLFIDVRYIAHYRAPCSDLGQQLRDWKHAR